MRAKLRGVEDAREEELWQEVLSRWQDDAAHAAFIEHCRLTNQLGQAARRYREEVRRSAAYRDDTTRAETAEKRLKGITSLAMLEITQSRPAAPATPSAVVFVRWAAVIILAVVICASMMFILRK
jgi:hypothetical protein